MEPLLQVMLRRCRCTATHPTPTSSPWAAGGWRSSAGCCACLGFPVLLCCLLLLATPAAITAQLLLLLTAPAVCSYEQRYTLETMDWGDKVGEVWGGRGGSSQVR